jgi:uncharacterized membrane protein YdjX (TVP38/TMEM64 family)
MNIKKTVLVIAVLAAAVAFFALDLGRFLSLDYLKQSQAQFATLVQSQPLLVAGSYFSIYVAATALSLPGAAIITLAGGAIFGLGWGLLIVSFASSIGATLAFLVARFLLRDSIEARFGNRLAEINRGVEKRRRVLPVHAAADSAGAVFRDQPRDGPDPDAGMDVLLGQPAGHAGGHRRLRERGHAARAH